MKELGDQARQDIAGRNTTRQRQNQAAATVPGQKGPRIDLIEGGAVFDVDPTAGLPESPFPKPSPRQPMQSATFPGTYGKDAA